MDTGGERYDCYHPLTPISTQRRKVLKETYLNKQVNGFAFFAPLR
jgi:hypothetical protein